MKCYIIGLVQRLSYSEFCCMSKEDMAADPALRMLLYNPMGKQLQDPVARSEREGKGKQERYMGKKIST